MPDYTKANQAVPQEVNDLIVYAKIIQLTAPSTFGQTYQTFSSGINGLRGIPIGIYTYDSGATYNDLGAAFPRSTGGRSFGYVGTGTQPSVTVAAIVKTDYSGDIVFEFNRTVAGVAAPVTIYLAVIDEGLGTGFFDSSVATDGKTAYSSKGTYRKIKQNYSAVADPLTTYAHGLAAIPTIIFSPISTFSIAGVTGYASVPTYNDASLSNVDQVKLDATNVYVGAGASAVILTRVYKEN